MWAKLWNKRKPRNYLIIRYLLSVPTVQVAVLMVEMQDGRTKASFRSRGKVYVNRLAANYGGGGHMNAAGCLFDLSSDKAQRVLLDDIRTLLNGNGIPPTKHTAE